MSSARIISRKQLFVTLGVLTLAVLAGPKPAAADFEEYVPPPSTVVPEPGTCALIASATIPLAGLVLRRFRK